MFKVPEITEIFLCSTWVERFSVQSSGLKRANPAAKRDQQKENTLIGANVMFHPMGERG